MAVRVRSSKNQHNPLYDALSATKESIVRYPIRNVTIVADSTRMRSRKAAPMQRMHSNTRIRKSDALARYNATILDSLCYKHRMEKFAIIIEMAGKLHQEIIKEELERARGTFP